MDTIQELAKNLPDCNASKIDDDFFEKLGFKEEG